MNITLGELHKKILYPVVRVRTQKGGGSGVIIYSHPVPRPDETVRPVDGEGRPYETYVLSCYHVVEDSIKFTTKWSSIAKRDVKAEVREDVTIEVFEYEGLSRCVGASAYMGEIVAWDKDKDLAILKLRTGRKFEYVVKLYPRGKSEEIVLGRPIVACGCSLGHEPLFTFGHLVSKHDKIDNEEYWMTTANTIFGNSGGAVFLADTLEFIGSTARVTGLQLGFGVDIVTWMGFFIPIESIYKFLDDNFMQFIYDPLVSSAVCERRRREKEMEEEKKLLLPVTTAGGETT